MTQKFREDPKKNISVLAPPLSPSKITKSFFRKNGKHLEKDVAVKLFKQDVLLAEKLDYKYDVVAVFGSARVCENFHKNLANASYELGYSLGKNGFAVSTGGGPGIMEFVSKGATDANSVALGFQPKFIEELEPPVIFRGKKHYLVYSLHSRKILMAKNASSFVFFPGGAGTVDEFFHYLNFAQNKWIENVKFILFDSKFWAGLIKWVEEKLVKNNLVDKKIFEDIVIVDGVQQAKDIIIQNKQNAAYYCPNPLKLSINFEDDIKQIYNYIEKLNHPSASFFGDLKNKSLAKLVFNLTKKLQKENFTIYYSSNNGLADFLKQTLKAQNSKNINFEIPLNLVETKKLILGSTDKLFFLSCDLECVDALTEYVVRIQMGDMEKVQINILEPQFWKDYLDWFLNFPIKYGFAEEELIKLFNFVNSKKDIKI